MNFLVAVNFKLSRTTQTTRNDSTLNHVISRSLGHLEEFPEETQRIQTANSNYLLRKKQLVKRTNT